ncbi:MAG: hypothetical protein PWQ55_416 [Chloroflexota bacterium]|nr:hypothetical protein [Chloroflexota bacterium]
MHFFGLYFVCQDAGFDTLRFTSLEGMLRDSPEGTLRGRQAQYKRSGRVLSAYR